MQVKLKDVVAEFIVPMRDKPKKFDGDIPWCRIEDIQGKYLHGTLSNQFVSSETIISHNIEAEKNRIIKENRDLAALREFLLPMLMNGQVGFGEV